MATTKRERQKAARRAKLEQQQIDAKRRQLLRRSVIIAVIAVVVIGSAALLFSGKSSPSATPTTTTLATTSTTTTTPTTTTTSSSSNSSSTTTTTAPVSTTTAPNSITWAALKGASPAGTFGTAPTVNVPAGAPPTTPERADLITGTGAAAKAGDKLTVQYVLATYSSGKVIQSSWTSSPFSFTLGVGQVIKGWDVGVVGMKVGGRRELVLPPSIGYGNVAQGAGIAANDTLVFVVDLLKIG
jgi:peptidylprolyl isomerase